MRRHGEGESGCEDEDRGAVREASNSQHGVFGWEGQTGGKQSALYLSVVGNS